LPEMKRPQLRLFVAVNDDRGDEANQREAGDDCDLLSSPAGAGGGVCAGVVVSIAISFRFWVCQQRQR